MLLKFVDQNDPANKERFELAKLFLDELKTNSAAIFNDPNWLSEVQKIVDKVKATKSTTTTAGKQVAEATRKAAEFAKEALDQSVIAGNKAQEAQKAFDLIVSTKKEILKSNDITEMTTKTGIVVAKIADITAIYNELKVASEACLQAANEAQLKAVSTPEATKSANEARTYANEAEQNRADTESNLQLANNLLIEIETFVTNKKQEAAKLLTDKNEIEKKANAILAEIQSILATTRVDVQKAKDNITLVNGYATDASKAVKSLDVTTYINKAQSTYDTSEVLLNNVRQALTTAENKKTELGGLKKEFLPPSIQGTVNNTVSDVQGAVTSLESSITKIKATLDRIVLIKTTKENEEEKERLRLEAEKKAKEEADKKAEEARLAKEKEEEQRKAAAAGLRNAEAEKRAKIQQFEKDVSSVLSNVLTTLKLPTTTVKETTDRYNFVTNNIVKDRIRESLVSSVSADNVKGLYMLQPFDEE